MGISDDEKFFADLWLRQGELVWKAMALIPTIEAAVMAAWYVLRGEGSPDLAIGVAIVGIAVMIFTWIILDRTVGYVAHFRSQISRLLPRQEQGWLRSKLARLGRHVFVLLPLFCILVNIGLIFWTIFRPPHHRAPVSQPSTVIFMH